MRQKVLHSVKKYLFICWFD